jgi:hypothetical protein
VWEQPVTFESRWTVDASPSSVFELLMDIERIPLWLPDVCPEAQELRPEAGGRRARLAIRGLLPYTLRLSVSVQASKADGSIRIEAEGDLNGVGLWKIVPEPAQTAVAFACSIHPERPVLRIVNRVLWPLVVLNHWWVMRRVRKAMEKELRRRSRIEPNTL